MPVVTLRKTSLVRVPKSNENWLLKIPSGPQAGAAVVDYVISQVRSPLDGAAIGFINLYLQAVEQA